ncbi:Isoleucine--tRNA ligase [Polystyrenella longa]|uniref:Isoleucine--tRNA ligase n=1 Tax=Polystyrenella longa TaxID=2528007 RepID=A0A518CKC1_9PLAN|nr:class I tRNA ligase family protein [Polystyrenella longa]QDU79676.1 Isoleucine--tRNA ligase [Polystyrenella longa]
MFEKVSQDAAFVSGEHDVLTFWNKHQIFKSLREKNAGKPKWSFLDGPITANNPMGVHHAWGRTYKDAFQRYHAMCGRELRYQNGFDCQGLWVEVEVERSFGLPTKTAIAEYGIDKFVNACKKRVLTFAARQTEQSVRLGYWMDWDRPDQLRSLAEHIDNDDEVEYQLPAGETVTDKASTIVSKLGNPEWGGSYFTFSTENNETIWTFLKKCFERGKVYRGHDVMPWSGRGGSAYSQMEVADGRKLTTHRSLFVRFPLKDKENEYLLIWTTTPWTLTSNVAAAINPDLEYVRLQSKRDDAIYYFAKENLEYQRLSREFKEGFGRPEWSWPKDVPKLKSIAQIFKEQGGYEVLGTLKGSEMVGWEYEGPFDDLPAQQQPGGYPEDKNLLDKSGVSCHRVLDGGRDMKGQPLVVAGEGTGIVHTAPGCGDVDHTLGQENNIVSIAPLGEDGCFMEGFGEFTGREAIDPNTIDFVFSKLKEKHLLVYTETYPHIYPHCWRTGDELVFRLVDEWFINMDWREEIKDVTRQINWLPKNVQGEERELEWLSNMRDWMISKKRFWGLALPIWVDEETGDFEVIGSLAELKERAVEGWDEFEGHTPHRPWIDKVKIQNPNNGNIMSRVEDVGNPWLDAGIVPFSTMSFNRDKEAWKEWYPADFVTECFPGQFRNWFYALLSMGTMMDNSPPFKTLLGHRLVMNEEGKPMHKSDGTAIWFEEAAEQLGVDTLRWLYMAQNPANDLRFGTRHPDQPVTLQTVDGPVTETLEGVPTCSVSSKSADEIRRQILIPLWNSYAFFVNYARLDEFDTKAVEVPVADRPEIDRWVLSNLQVLVKEVNAGFENYDTASVCEKATKFIDELSNWYIRRNRRRFWRSQNAGDTDKLAAYQTLYTVLTTVSKLLAPIIPFVTERMYRNLVLNNVDNAPESVHLCDYPQADESLIDEDLNRSGALAQLVVKLGHKLREEANQRVRQPLAELKYATATADQAVAIANLTDVIKEELNVKQLTPADNLDALVSYHYKPNLKTLGPKYGKLLKLLREKLPEVGDDMLGPLRRGESVTIELEGNEISFDPEDVLVSTEQSAEWFCNDEQGVQIALSTVLTEELKLEGAARDFVRQVQQLRKEADLEIEDRINIHYFSADDSVTTAIEGWTDYIQSETLADSISKATAANGDAKEVVIGEAKATVWIAKV